MKLYTKEQVKEMIDDAHNGIDGYYDIFQKHTPIELPSDEEIEDNAKDFADYIGNKNGTAIFDYIKGAKWMREKILNK